ncbi:glycosyltransferase [Aequorivita marina]|uniref:glycosyltransferase n=1 Tax=Aequorivita marina TaxID=3073654 RepID=UPI002876C189|nr:glycosyltransferase [Aequorivita sp. S2608]MDS1299520.1 glycosyltransferase [Aequorivita sp. S2608]
MPKPKTVLVAPLHWGLGHATRCIPIIRALQTQGFKVLLASDGAALHLLRKEFPLLETVELPSYNITYPKNGNLFKWKILLQVSQIRKTIASEEKIVERLVSENKIQGIISDNRFGVHNKRIPSVYITHQLNVLTGSTTFFSSKMHQRIIRKFDRCWVPDTEDSHNNLSGKLGHVTKSDLPIKYIDILSRMEKRKIPQSISILILISGPEPQRTALEETLKPLFKNSEKRVVMVQGKVEANQKWTTFGNIEIVNYMTSPELEETLNKTELVICRSGYTTIMDLTMLGKKAFFIPTPGQYEQEYLAVYLEKLGLAPYAKQQELQLDDLDKLTAYKGLGSVGTKPVDFSELFTLFKGKREF